MSNIGNHFKRTWEIMIDNAGNNFDLFDKNGTSKGVVRAHFVQAERDDLTLVNTLGLDARIVTTKGDVEIKKFDQFISLTGKTYTVEASHEVLVGDVLVGYRVYLL